MFIALSSEGVVEHALPPVMVASWYEASLSACLGGGIKKDSAESDNLTAWMHAQTQGTGVSAQSLRAQPIAFDDIDSWPSHQLNINGNGEVPNIRAGGSISIYFSV